MNQGNLAQRLAWVPTAAAVISVTGVIGALWLHWRTVSGSDVQVEAWAADYVAAVTYPVVGAWLVRRRPENRVGWALSFASLLGVYVFCAEYAVLGILAEPGSLPLTSVAAWVGVWGWIPHLVLPTLVPLLFPDGTLRGRKERALFKALLFGVSLVCVARVLSPSQMDYSLQIVNPIGIEGANFLNWIVRIASTTTFAIGAPLSALALLLRARSARGAERAQMQWLMTSGVLLVLAALSSFVVSPQIGATLWAAFLAVVPATIFVAVVRHQLLDIELVLNRSLVVLFVSVVVIAGYFAGVAVVSGLDLDDRVAYAVVAVTALAAATTRGLVQRLVNRLLFGEGDDPYAVAARVGGRLDLAAGPVEALEAIATELRKAFRLPYVAFVASDVIKPVVAGTKREHAETFAVVSLGKTIGSMHVGHRHPKERFTDEENVVFADVARRAAAFLHSASLLEDLQASRERVVVAREEERRRLRNDLHDGMGPQLAGIALELDMLVAKHPGQAQELEHARDGVRGAIREVRRIVDDLGPSALDRLGFTGAVEQLVANMSGGATEVLADLPATPMALPAAVEVAAYRVVGEAINNATRHGRPSRCTVDVSDAGSEVVVVVTDDGTGIPVDYEPGVGIASMTERVAEVGGTLTVASPPSGGTIVTATFPKEAR